VALIVEDGTGKSDADAYVSVATFDAYHLKFGNTVPASTTDEKEVAIRRGTRYVDLNYIFKGRKKTDDQALEHPRAWLDDGTYPVSSEIVHQKVQDAACEAALRFRTADMMPDVSAPGRIKRERRKVGPLETETEYVGGGKKQIKDYQVIDAILAKLTRSSTRVLRT
jgi:hypothetical protein